MSLICCLQMSKENGILRWNWLVDLEYCVYLVIKYERIDFSFESDFSTADKMVPDSLKYSRKPVQNSKPHPWFFFFIFLFNLPFFIIYFILEDYNYLTSFPPFLFLPLGPFIYPSLSSFKLMAFFFINYHEHICVYIYS